MPFSITAAIGFIALSGVAVLSGCAGQLFQSQLGRGEDVRRGQ
jgi:Cu/Ag efflux pump CusA